MYRVCYMWLIFRYFSSQGKVWGVAYEITSRALLETMGYLNNREKTLGGYTTIVIDFFPREHGEDPIPVLLYIATQDNEHYLGEDSIISMAKQVVYAKGNAGPNIDYVTKMADYIRENIPEDEDEHLFALDRKVREIASHKKKNRKISERCADLLYDHKDNSWLWTLEHFFTESVSAS